MKMKTLEADVKITYFRRDGGSILSWCNRLITAPKRSVRQPEIAGSYHRKYLQAQGHGKR
jgi:hypothetical protein